MLNFLFVDIALLSHRPTAAAERWKRSFLAPSRDELGAIRTVFPNKCVSHSSRTKKSSVCSSDVNFVR